MKIIFLKNVITSTKSLIGSFLLEPLEIGQGITLGNSLRRVLLSNIAGIGITTIKLNNLRNEFETIEGCFDDTFNVLANLKGLVIKPLIPFSKLEKIIPLHGFLYTNGPKVVTGGMLSFPKNTVGILNENHYICTLTEKVPLFMEVSIQIGSGILMNSNEISSTPSNSRFNLPTIFSPVKKVNYSIELINDSQGNIKERLLLQIETNGQIAPKRALNESIKYVLDLYYPLLKNSNQINLN